MDFAELIINKLKCLNRRLKSNNIIISTDKAMFMLISYNKNINFPIVKIGNNKINETPVTKFLSIHLDTKLNFVHHITKMSIQDAK